VSAPRFLVARAVLDQRRVENAAARFRLELCFDGAGVRAFASPGYAIRLLNNRGVILGTLFERNGPPEAIAELNADQQKLISAKGERALLERYWGAYCSLLSDGADLTVMRDPSGGLPVYHSSAADACVIGSDPEIIAATGYWKPAVSWEDLASHLYTRGLPTPVTPLKGLAELLPGTACNIRDDSMSVEGKWSPWDHTQPVSASNITEQAEDLHHTIQNVISAWSSKYPSILIGVSGGLDSSIVAASIPARRAKVVGVTLVTDDPDGDERLFTRFLGNEIGLEILEVQYDPADIDLATSCVAHLARPIGRSHALAYDRAIHRIALSTAEQKSAMRRRKTRPRCYMPGGVA